jgi:hypothetical protein
VTIQRPLPTPPRAAELAPPNEKPDFSRDIPVPVSEPSIEPIGDDDIVKIWPRLIDLLGTQSSAVKSVLSLATLSELRDGQAVIRFRHEQETFAKTWAANGKREMIAAALTKLRGQSVGVRFEVDDAPAGPAAAATVSMTAEKPSLKAAEVVAVESAPVRPNAEIVQELENDPLVQLVLKEFGGKVVPPRNERT